MRCKVEIDSLITKKPLMMTMLRKGLKLKNWPWPLLLKQKKVHKKLNQNFVKCVLSKKNEDIVR